jgi:hypothetical protein
MRHDIYNLDSRTLAAIRIERGAVDSLPERRREPEIASGSAAPRAARPTRPTNQTMTYDTRGYFFRPLTLQPIYR